MSITPEQWHNKMQMEIAELRSMAADVTTRHSATLGKRMERMADRLSGHRMWVLAHDIVPPSDNATQGERCTHGFPIGMHCFELMSADLLANLKVSEAIHDELNGE